MKQQNQKLTHVKHEFDPIFDENSEILILGTLPSVKSREQNFLLWTSAEPFLESHCGTFL